MLLFGFFLFFSIAFANIQSSYLSSIKSLSIDMMKNNLKTNDTGDNNVKFQDIISSLFDTFYSNCSKELEQLNPNDTKINKRYSKTKYPFLIDYIGKTLNDLADEIECQNSFDNNVYYAIVVIQVKNFINSVDFQLMKFLNLTHFCVGGCVTKNCFYPLRQLLDVVGTINNNLDTSSNNIYIKNTSNEKFIYFGVNESTFEKEDYSKYPINYTNYKVAISWIILFYFILKIGVGIFRLIYIPKGYERQAIKYIKSQNIENLSLIQHNNQEGRTSNLGEYDPNFDFSSKYPLSFKIIHMFDFFDDVMFLSTVKNKYYNDKGLESINFVRFCVLLFYVFFNTFNSLLLFPSKDILNKTFFSSYLMFIYRLSTYSLTGWIVLEAAHTSYKLIQYIKVNIFRKENNNKILFCQFFIVYGKFILFFIPKIFMFFFSFYFFYYKVEDFRNFFDAKVTFEYIKENIINQHITPNVFPSISSIFNFSFTPEICYDFFFLYVNLFLSTFVFMIVLFIIFKYQKIIIEVVFIIINFISFICFIFPIEDKNLYYPNKEGPLYSFYHFKGHFYLSKKFYLLLGVYNFGFILGLICFNYRNNKDKFNQKTNEGNINDNDSVHRSNSDYSSSSRNKTVVSSKNSSFNSIEITYDQYFPLSFFNEGLKKICQIKYILRIIIVFVCVIFISLLSNLYRFYGLYEKGSNDKDYVLGIDFNAFMRAYFLFEKHIFLLLFLIINIILITLSEKGIYRSISKLKLINAISRVGSTIVCLSFIFSTFSLCGFMVKIKFNIPTIILISFGNFFITFTVSILLNAIFELPIKIGITMLLRKWDKKNKEKKELDQLLPTPLTN